MHLTFFLFELNFDEAVHKLNYQYKRDLLKALIDSQVQRQNRLRLLKNEQVLYRKAVRSLLKY